MAAAASLSSAGTLRPATFNILFGLLAATGMRVSEALALRLSDVTDDGLIVKRPSSKRATGSTPPINLPRAGRLSGAYSRPSPSSCGCPVPSDFAAASLKWFR